jgi:hypothetical protein
MNLTTYDAKYFAHELTKRCSSDSMEKLAGAVASAQVDLNPHQVDAARGWRTKSVSEDHRGGTGPFAEVGRAEARDLAGLARMILNCCGYAR